MKQAIVLAAYGSRHEKAVASLDHIATRVRQSFPGVPVRLAYTSRTVRGHMKQQGQEADSVPKALDRLLDEGVTHAVIQSLHIIPGSEYHELLSLANDLMLRKGGFTRVEVGFPLVAGERGVERVARAIAELVPQCNTSHEAVIFMGHGTMHPGNAYYEALHAAIQEHDPSVHVGALEAEPGIDDILVRLARQNITRAHLLPFLFGAGWHAAKDMVGDHPESWKSRLEQAGIHCEAILKGAGEYDQLVQIWLDHLSDAMQRLQRG
ncbi:sirohydrochlorin cobaltochelatase [Pseudodesulfovibrio tunisiensis]|uniref:sirohydrochlorin cobaltochelatase n=1 Tax=Pseudodesulfovibrio tunisiensis TaxID=463192 RepID=UPI001FB223A3|nr:sirohydrochlorin cobaltochelatase [Pseudodesulfovibrio tunisiensis]